MDLYALRSILELQQVETETLDIMMPPKKNQILNFSVYRNSR